MPIQTTLAIVKPDATARPIIGSIISVAEVAGLSIVAARMARPGRPVIESLYAEHREREYFTDLVDYMVSGPILVLALHGNEAVSVWRTLMGATDLSKAAIDTLRQRFAESQRRNSVHGSDSPESAAREISLFFSEDELFRGATQ